MVARWPPEFRLSCSILHMDASNVRKVNTANTHRPPPGTCATTSAHVKDPQLGNTNGCSTLCVAHDHGFAKLNLNQPICNSVLSNRCIVNKMKTYAFPGRGNQFLRFMCTHRRSVISLSRAMLCCFLVLPLGEN